MDDSQRPTDLNDDFADLVQRYFDGQLSQEEEVKFLDSLEADEDRRREFVEHCLYARLMKEQLAERLGEDLSVEMSDAAEAQPTIVGESRVARAATAALSFAVRPTPLSLTVAAVVVGLFVTSLAFIAVPLYQQYGNVAEVDDSNPVAQLTGLHEARWSSAYPLPRPGARLHEGQRLDLQRGVAEVTMRSNARLIVEAPAAVVLRGVNQIELLKGKLVAHVPQPAVGFLLSCTAATVRDLGTEFGAHARGAALEVEVFDGEVEVRPKGGDASAVRRIERGEALVINNGDFAAPTAPMQFIRQLPPRYSGPKPQLLAFYPLDGDADDASGNLNHATNVSNVTFVDGYEGQAARFAGRLDSFIDLPVNASAEALPVMTWGAWVRPRLLEGMRRTVVSTDNGGFDRTLTIDERTGHSAQAYDPAFPLRYTAFAGPNVGVLASPGPTAQASRWTFVAAVYDQRRQLVRLFVEDANEIGSRGKLLQIYSRGVTVGPSVNFVRIGMHADGIEEPFSGEIDNVFVLQGALSTAELDVIRQRGRQALGEFVE